jgi:hypothetical protein
LTLHAVRRQASFIPPSDIDLRIAGIPAVFILDRQGTIYDQRTKEAAEVGERTRGKLLDYADQLRRAHYGEYIPWDQAKALLPMKSLLTIVDLETGSFFHAQRRAGRDHADVQPLTRKDTAVMRRIYDGRWSWNRRAILVKIGGRTLAASMHGMPHGGDGIPGNGFSGHFCVHFLGSSTHRSGLTDPDHQFMVHKAAGKLDEYMAQATPAELVSIFVTAVNANEAISIKKLYQDAEHPQISGFLAHVSQWSSWADGPAASLSLKPIRL